jgi:hypothetical protein
MHGIRAASGGIAVRGSKGSERGASRDRRNRFGGKRLRAALGAVVLGSVWTVGWVDPWQSWSYDGFWGQDRPLADPGALYASLDEVTVYGTSASTCILSSCQTYWVPRYTSTSLSATAGLQSDAMPTLPAWVPANNRQIWAPSVVEIAGAYVMYFGATAGVGPNVGLKCVGAATAATPAGPFAPRSTPLACAGPGYWALDPYAVTDGDRLYLLWREDDATHVLGKIVSAELSPDGLSFAGAAKRTLLEGEYAWEDSSAPTGIGEPRAPPPGPFDRYQPAYASTGAGLAAEAGSGSAGTGIGPIENPAMARHPGTGEWLLTWSANSWNTQRYATGLAVCDGPLGPCTRTSTESPWLRTTGDASIQTSAAFGGSGGLSFVYGPDLCLYAVFHAYRGTADASTSFRIGWAYRVDATPDGYRFSEF